MPSYKYIQWCQIIYEEITETLSNDEKTLMSNTLKSLTPSEYLEKEKSLRKDVWKFLKATPAQRKANKSWNETPGHSVLLKYFALKDLLMGYRLLKSLESLPQHGGYRELISHYSVEAAYLREAPVPVELNYFPADFS
ncbi:MAG: hypothetical protein IPM96_16070 [Ignavibacteria bacterium]|nr:hypothetical protein [Ignavibacteria bacterium]